jgi:hypothetical protein
MTVKLVALNYLAYRVEQDTAQDRLLDHLRDTRRRGTFHDALSGMRDHQNHRHAMVGKKPIVLTFHDTRKNVLIEHEARPADAWRAHDGKQGMLVAKARLEALELKREPQTVGKNAIADRHKDGFGLRHFDLPQKHIAAPRLNLRRRGYAGREQML